MQSHLARLLTVGDVETKRSDRRSHPRADAVADDERRFGDLIECIAGVDECRDTPGLIDPSRCFEAADDIVTRGNGCFAVFHAQALKSVTANGCVAPGAKQERGRNFLPRRAEYAAAFETCGQLVVASDRIPVAEAGDNAAK